MNLDTDEGMIAAKAWLQNTIDMLKDGGMWAIPRSFAIYTFDKKNKIVTRINNDEPTDKVLEAMGWKLN